MTIETLRALSDNFIYLIRKENEVVVVDPGEASPVLKALNTNDVLKAVLCTHHHADHVAGARELKERFGAQVICAEGDLTRIEAADERVTDNQDLKLLNETVKVLAMPGHTKFQVAYYLESAGALFTGDTLFSAGCGRLFEGTAEQMWKSLKKISALPKETKIYFGHEYTIKNLDFVLSRKRDAQIQSYRDRIKKDLELGRDSTPSTLEIEARVNPFLTAKTEAEFREWRTARDHW